MKRNSQIRLNKVKCYMGVPYRFKFKCDFGLFNMKGSHVTNHILEKNSQNTLWKLFHVFLKLEL